MKSFNHCELYLNLPGDFEVTEGSESFDLVLSNGTASVAVARISFIAGYNQGIPDTLTAKAFADFFMIQSGIESTVHVRETIPYYSYKQSTGNVEYYCLASFYRTMYAYFIVLYSVKADLEEEWRESFMSYMMDVRIIYDD